MINPATSHECLQDAWAALLKGDTSERDRLLRRAETLLKAEAQADAVERALKVDFYVTAKGIAVPTLTMARAAGALQ